MHTKQNNESRTRRWIFMFLCMIGGYGLTVPPVGATPFAYVANQRSNSLSVIDTATNAVVDTVSSISHPGAVAVSPDGKRVYVTAGVGINGVNNQIVVIDTTTRPNRVVDNVTVQTEEESPSGMAVSPDGKRVYVAMYGNSLNSHIAVIDTTTHPSTVVDRVYVEAGTTSVAISPDGKRVYSTNLDGHTVSVVDTTTKPNTVLQTISIIYPAGVAVSPDGTRIYVSEEADGAVSVVDTTIFPNKIVDRVLGFSIPWGVAVSPNGQRVYVGEQGGSSVAVIDTTTQPNTIVDRVVVEAGVDLAIGLVVVSPDGKRVYAPELDYDSVAVIDTTTQPNILMEKIIGFSGPTGMAIGPAPLNLYPTTKEQCKNGGWKAFGFKNQGQCIQYVNTRNEHDHDEKHDQGGR